MAWLLSMELLGSGCEIVKMAGARAVELVVAESWTEIVMSCPGEASLELTSGYRLEMID